MNAPGGDLHDEEDAPDSGGGDPMTEPIQLTLDADVPQVGFSLAER
ncbi:hypothetical protein [Streptomyces sp. OE57]